MTWKLADAKNKLSELVNKTLEGEPQTIARRGDEVIVISKSEYLKLKGAEPSFTEFLMNGPSLEGVDLKRKREPMREVEL